MKYSIAFSPKLIVGVIFMTTVVAFPASAADLNSSSPTSQGILSVGKKWTQDGLINGAVKAKSIREGMRFEVTVKKAEFGTNSLVSDKNLRFDFQLAALGTNQDVTDALRQIKDDLGKACVGGSFSFIRPSTSRGELQVINEQIQRAQKEKLLGEFACKNGESTLFYAGILSDNSGAKGSLFPPTFAWPVYAHIVSSEKISKQEEYNEKSATANEDGAKIKKSADDQALKVATERTQGLKNTIAVGATVGVPASEVPSAVRPNTPKFAEIKYAVCGLITEVKHPLVQVQISQSLIYVPVDQLLQIASRIGPGDKVPVEHWTTWCVGNY